MWATVPRRACAAARHVIAVTGRNRDGLEAFYSQPLRELPEIGRYRIETGLVEAHEVELVDRQDNVANAKQGNDYGVTQRLRQETLAGIDQNDGQLRVRGA